MNKIQDILLHIDKYLGGSPWFVFLLLGTGLFFTIYLKFPQLRYFKYAFKIVGGKFDRAGDKGDTSHFEALATALSGTVGTGNIAGVALAIHLGGPAALFWMLITALLGMATKFVEVTLSHKYREKTKDGTMAGGPMYYMKNRLNLKWLAVIFALATVLSSFGTGSLPQINTISNTLYDAFGIDLKITGAVLALLLAFVIMGGIKRISKVTSKLVPIMALLYFLGAIAVISFNYQNIIPSLVAIVSDVFTGTSAVGGFVGASFALAFNRGVNRGLFSNEAGQGSSPIAHAAARGHEPVSEGLVALLEPFIDTVVVCMLTGLVILSSGVWSQKVDNKFQLADIVILNNKYNQEDANDVYKLQTYLSGGNEDLEYSGSVYIKEGALITNVEMIHARSVAENVQINKHGAPYTGAIEVVNGRIRGGDELNFTGKSLIHSAPLTTLAFSKSWLGIYGKYIVSIGILLFAFSTAISWSYYGDRAMIFLFGRKYLLAYRLVYVVSFFLASFADTTIIWNLSGIAVVLMAVPNLIGILLLRKEMKNEIGKFWKEYSQRFPNEPIP